LPARFLLLPACPHLVSLRGTIFNPALLLFGCDLKSLCVDEGSTRRNREEEEAHCSSELTTVFRCLVEELLPKSFLEVEYEEVKLCGVTLSSFWNEVQSTSKSSSDDPHFYLR